jgi:YfiH family protein
VSSPPYDELNLGGNTGDAADDVEVNRGLVAGSLGLQRDRLLFMTQCHGTEVAVVDAAGRGAGPEADGLVTTGDDLALAVLVADCVPVLLADVAAGVVGAVHAGRPGMTSGIIGHAVQTMRGQGATELAAAVGPSVCGRCYEVPEAMRDAAAAVSPVSATVSWTGTAAIDVAAGVVDQLRRHDVAVTWVPGCSREDDRLYSYRRARETGRFAGVVRLLPPRTNR